MRFFVLLLAPLVAGFLKTKGKYSFNTSVKVDGNLVGEGDQLNGAVNKCVSSSDKKFTQVEVCGCEVKVATHLMTRCEEYHTYSEEVGACDCTQSGCVTKDLTFGNGHEKEAMSYMIVPCK